MKRLAITCAALVLSVAVLACGGTAHEGSPCQAGAPQCQDEQTALFCDDGFYRAIPCRGGCSATTIGDQPVISCLAGEIKSGDECDEAYAGLVGECQPLGGPDGGYEAEVCGGDIWRATVCFTNCVPGIPGVGEVEDPGTCE